MNNSEEKYSVAVIILNYNGRHHLEKFLPSVIDSVSEQTEVIIADNASTDDSVDFLNRCYPHLPLILLEKNFGFAEGYNKAVAAVKHEFVILLNSDVEVPLGWIEPLINTLKDNNMIAAVQPKILSYSDKKKFEHAGAAGGMIDFLGYPFCRGRIFLITEQDNGQYDQEMEIFWASGAAMCLRRKVFIELGGFDGDYFAHMEEIDFCWRAKKAGFSILFQPSSVVYHLGGGTLDYVSSFKVYLNFRNSLYTIFKNASISTLCWLLPVRLFLDGLAGVFYLAKGKFNLIWMIIKAHFAFYLSMPGLLVKRKEYHGKIQKCCVSPENNVGVFFKSIVYQHFVKKKSTFNEIFPS